LNGQRLINEFTWLDRRSECLRVRWSDCDRSTEQVSSDERGESRQWMPFPLRIVLRLTPIGMAQLKWWD